MNRRDFISKITRGAVVIAIAPTILFSKEEEVGKNFSTFVLRFQDNYLEKYNVITIYTPEEDIQVLIKTEPVYKNGWYSYDCAILTGDQNAFIPAEYLEGEIKFEKNYSVFEQTMHKRMIEQLKKGRCTSMEVNAE